MNKKFSSLELTVLLMGSILKRNNIEFYPEYLEPEAIEYLEPMGIDPEAPAIEHVERIHAALLDWEQDVLDSNSEN